MRNLTAYALCLSLAGCAGSIDHGDDPVESYEGAALRLVLSGRALVAPRAFVRVRLLVEAPADAPLEVATSADGRTFGPFRPLTVLADEEPEPAELEEPAPSPDALAELVDPEAAPGELDAVGEVPDDGAPEQDPGLVRRVAVLDLDRPASHFRVRVAGQTEPTYLALEFLDADGRRADDLAVSGTVTLDPGVGVLRQGATFKIYRFDLGRVTQPWLWALRTARKAGWRGRLAGSRTGLRTYAEQAALYRAYKQGRGAPAFPPNGPSRHLIPNVQRLGRWAQAVDTQDVPRLITLMRRRGVSLRRPYGHEPWHVEATRAFKAK